MTEPSPFAESCDLPSREDVQELRESIESLRDHVQIIWQAIDEVREVIDQAIGPDSAEFWNVEPPQGLPLGRYRPFAGYEPVAEWYEADGQVPESVDAPGEVVEPPVVLVTPKHARTGHQQQMWLDDETAGHEPAIEGSEAESKAAHKVAANSLPTAAAEVISSPLPHAEVVDTTQHQRRPYTLDDWIAFRHRFSGGEVDAAGIQAEFRRMQAGREYFITQLVRSKSADQLRLMATEQGILNARRNTKQENALSLYRSHLAAFTLDQAITYQPMQESYEEAVERIVLALSDEAIDQQREKRRREREAREKALTNPETFEELSQFVGRKGTEALSDEQLAAWDRYNADISRAGRKSRQKETVEQFQSAEIASADFRIVEGFHDREQVPLWIVQLASRVERSAFHELKIKARQLGGWWSSFKRDAAGFQFRSRESAEKFAGLTERDVDRAEELAARKLRKMDSASVRLNTVAESLETKATEVLAADADKLKNTARRAGMAASMRAQAYRDQADAKTLRSIAAALEEGNVTYLDGVWNAAQVRTLKVLLDQARRARIERRLKEEGIERRAHGWSQRYDELEAEPLSPADARFARYSTPYLSRGHLTRAFLKLANTAGAKRAAAKMRKLIDSGPKGEEYIEFVNDYEVELLEDFLGRAKAAGCDIWWFDHCLDNYKRLKSAGIHDNHELRCALRELVPHLAMAAADNPVTKAEDELRGKNIPEFFPTPRPLIERMLDVAQVEATHRVLEPSCGKGDILDVIRERHPEADLRAVEQNLTLQGVLTAKGYCDLVNYEDFSEHRGEYDRCIMNPPFSRDIEHIRHAYDLLAPGGRLVAIASEHGFFASDARSVKFREWLCGLDDAYVEELPANAFKGVDLFRQTGVRTRLVVINKA